MAQIETLYAEQTTEQTTTSTTYQTALSISGGSIAANSTWAIWAVTSVGQSGNNIRTKVRLTIDGTNVDLESKQFRTVSGPPDTYYTRFEQCRVFSFGASPGAVEIEFANDTGATTARLDSIRIFMMRLDVDLVRGIDWEYTEEVSSTTLTNSFAQWVSATINLPVSTDVAVWNSFIYDSQSATADTLSVRMVKDGATAGNDILPQCDRTASFATQFIPYLQSRVYESVSAGQHTFESQVKATGTPVINKKVNGIFVLSLNRFSDTTIGAFTTADKTFSATDTFEEVQGVSITPGTTGEFITFGCATCDPTNTSAQNDFFPRVQIDAVTTPTGDDSITGGRYFENTNDLSTLFWFARHSSLTASTLYDIDVDAAVGASTSNKITDYQFATIGMEITAAGKSLSGIAMHGGRPESGAVIIAYKELSDYAKLAETVSGADGSWTLTGLPTSGQVVIVQKGPDGFNDKILGKMTPQ